MTKQKNKIFRFPEDKVPNNRLLLIRQLPSLKAMIVMPTEKKYLQTLETCVRSMAVSEKDKDVTAELKLSIHRLDKTETLTEGVMNFKLKINLIIIID